MEEMMKTEFFTEEDIKFKDTGSWSLEDVIKKDPFSFLRSDEGFLREYRAIIELKKAVENERETVEATQVKFTKFLLSVLEVVDFWERIFENKSSESEEIVKRLKSGYELLLEKLSEIGVRQNGPSKGMLLRSGKDIVEGTEERNDFSSGVICDIIKKTYLWNDKILRKSRVIVSKTKT